MKYICVLLCVIIALTGCSKQQPEEVIPGTGRLQRWSKQTARSHKKVIFVQSKVETSDPDGLTLPEIEKFFSPKVLNINYLGTELINLPMFEATELWFYSYYPNQELPKIMGDLVEILQENTHFDNSLIYALGYSQGGEIVWLTDQRYSGVLTGGDILGSALLSMPLAHPAVRNEAIRKTFPLLAPTLIAAFDEMAGNLEHLQPEYPETGQCNGDFRCIAGRIQPPPDNFFRRNFNLLDAATASHNFLTGIRDERQFAELGSYLMNNANWRSGSDDDRLGDGVASVSSATLDRKIPFVVLDDYDHLDLLSGKGDLVLDQLIAEHIVEVLDLAPKWVETDLPETPEVIELSEEVGNALNWCKFAYTSDNDGRLWVTDEDWREMFRMPISGQHSYPRFSPDNQSLVFTIDDKSQSNVYQWLGEWAGPISFDGTSKLADFSPDGRWLVYQSQDRLVIHHLERDRRYVVVTGVDMVIPPIWTVAGLKGQLYFTHRTGDGIFDVYRVSPRSRDEPISNVELVQSNCCYLFVVRGRVTGIIALGAPTTSSAGVISQSITVISGLASTRLNLTIRVSPGDYDNISGRSWNKLLIELNRTFAITEIAFDQQYGHLYMIDQSGENPGLYVFDINSWLFDPDVDEWEDVFYRLVGDVSQLDLKTPRR